MGGGAPRALPGGHPLCLTCPRCTEPLKPHRSVHSSEVVLGRVDGTTLGRYRGNSGGGYCRTGETDRCRGDVQADGAVASLPAGLSGGRPLGGEPPAHVPWTRPRTEDDPVRPAERWRPPPRLTTRRAGAWGAWRAGSCAGQVVRATAEAPVGPAEQGRRRSSGAPTTGGASGSRAAEPGAVRGQRQPAAASAQESASGHGGDRGWLRSGRTSRGVRARPRGAPVRPRPSADREAGAWERAVTEPRASCGFSDDF